MTQYKRHQNAKRILSGIISNPEKYLIIHYSCESFVDKQDGRTPRITTIAVRDFNSCQTKTFSIHEIAEQKSVPINKIEEDYNSLERKMLDQYFDFVAKHEHSIWIHWNMRDSNYGFYAIENRYSVLGGEPISISNDRKIDLAKLLPNYYGKNYIENPRMEKLADKNNLTKLQFLTGAEEAKAFEDKEYIKLRNSTLRKVELFYEFVLAATDGKLKTNSTWKDKYGVSMQGIYETIKGYWWFNLIVFLLGILGGFLLE